MIIITRKAFFCNTKLIFGGKNDDKTRGGGFWNSS